MSDVKRVRSPIWKGAESSSDAVGRTGRAPAPIARPASPSRSPADAGQNSFPNPNGTAVLHLSAAQTALIRTLLIALRIGKSAANDVRSQIFDLLSGEQRRALGAAYFILSVRV